MAKLTLKAKIKKALENRNEIVIIDTVDGRSHVISEFEEYEDTIEYHHKNFSGEIFKDKIVSVRFKNKLDF